ncbi:MAG: hypothetical protein J0I88_10155 [Chryseobacterium sp.]|uniref:Uncharacterized protein n=1 Tax=Epilithonimonas pallida TaxID=373671 RepID=A0ABY1R4U7_9FLAO|nr:hypothetical protein [Epilithonimonas pallida]MBN9338188.1 hypothetical protein [Chryseobacterium sp.]SMP95625.1 hypothetical protein SAMN05421679_107183 [Epilithonimonas pallida]
MFIKVFTAPNTFVLVNVSHIVYINPGNSNRGCSLILDTGVRLNSIEDYDVLLKQIE